VNHGVKILNRNAFKQLESGDKVVHFEDLLPQILLHNLQKRLLGEDSQMHVLLNLDGGLPRGLLSAFGLQSQFSESLALLHNSDGGHQLEVVPLSGHLFLVQLDED